MAPFSDGAAARTAPRPAIENKCLRSNRKVPPVGMKGCGERRPLYCALPGLSIPWGTGSVRSGAKPAEWSMARQATGVRIVEDLHSGLPRTGFGEFVC